MTDVAIDTLRIRGPGARRLAAVAARALPAALERALADVADVAVDTVEVTLALDPDGYDDETLAILWADAIRARVLAAGRSTRPSVRRDPSAVADPGRAPVPSATDVLVAARAWLAARASAADPPPLPRALLALGDGPTARTVAGAAGPDEWSRLVAALGAVLPYATDAAAPAGSVASAAPAAAPVPAQPANGSREPYVAEPTGEERTPAADPRLRPAGERGVLETLALLADLAPEPAPAVDPAAVTRAAGLVLLYPWLADHCRLAAELHPGLDPLDVRAAALAALVDPDDHALADDPLVALLAGRPDTWPDRTSRTRISLPCEREVADSATRVLAAFAALLPGFEESTTAFVRESWIARLGLLDSDHKPILLTAAIHPLDVLLPRLPYPVGLIKLPWSPPLSVRFR